MRHLRSRASAFVLLMSALALVTAGCGDDRDHPGGDNGAAGMGGAGGQAGGGGGSGGASGGGAGGEGGVGGLIMEEPGEFVSADPHPNEFANGGAGNAGGAGMSASSGAGGAGGTGGAGAPSDPREVVEGDIYRVLDAGALLNLNSYRGLQVIDVSDPSDPGIIGRFSIVGTPVEMYVRGTTAFVLLNDWQGYYGTREDVAVEHKQGGLVVKVDISDRTAPREIDRHFVEGSITTSRVVQNDTVAALYIASSYSAQDETDPNGNWVSKTVVTSFDIAGELVKKSELDLGGWVTDIQATPTELLVANTHWNSGPSTYSVSVVDISDPNGAMVLGDSVATQGPVEDQFNMDLYNGILRVVSYSWETNTNQVQTFAAHDLMNITPLHSCTFGAGQQLYATLFLGNKAFFVTYLRTDPFHAFAIGDDGACEERNEFIVSGWNDFLRPVADATRLVGVGVDDASGNRRPAVSVYDITDLDNASPLLARAEATDVHASWSEAMIDHRAFSVIEDAVSVLAEDGITTETGLVLLPYEGYDNTGYRYNSGVALFTFSDHTVTQRGTLSHDSPVRRTFTTDATTIANLSETSLSLYDHSDPTDPEPLGTLELASDFRRLLRFGDYVARVRRSYQSSYWSYLEMNGVTERVDMVPADGDLNYGEPVASFEVPGGAKLLKAGERLVAVTQLQNETANGDGTYGFDTEVTVFDLSDPTAPRKGGTAVTDDLVPTYFGYGYGYGYPGFWGNGFGFVGCGVGLTWFDGSQADGVFALGDRVVFVDARGETASIGRRTDCSYYSFEGCSTGNCQDHLSGYASCSTVDGGEEVCTSNLSRCDTVDFNQQDCVAVDFEAVRDQLQESCYTQEMLRGWSRYAFKSLDISDPDEPVFGELLNMPRTEEGVSVLPDGDSLYYTYQVPVRAPDDGRKYVSYYYKRLSFDDVSAIEVAPRINIPGELIAVSGERLYTKDIRWGEHTTDAYMHELSVSGEQAEIEASRAFTRHDINTVAVDGDRLYVVHQPTYDPNNYVTEYVTKLAVLGAAGLSFETEIEVDSWATLEAVHEGRALFTVSGGLLMMNVEDPTAPYAQAFFNSNGWPEQILFEQGEILISAGLYGIHRFDADDANLLTEE